MRLAIILMVPAMAVGSETLSAPSLGAVFNLRDNEMRRISGMKGAAVLGDAVRLPGSYTNISYSPECAYAIAISAEGRVDLVDVRTDAPASRPLAGAMAAPQVIALSRSGDSAALYSDSRVQVFAGLPHTPQLVSDVRTGLGATVGQMAVADQGRLIVAIAGHDAWLLDNGVWIRWLQDATGAVAFARTGAFAVTKAGEVMRRDGTGTVAKIATLEPAGDVLAMQVSPDGQRLWFATADGTISALDLPTGSWTRTNCSCIPSGLHPTRVPGWFRITDPGDQPVLMLDASTTTPKMWFIPAVTRTTTQDVRR